MLMALVSWPMSISDAHLDPLRNDIREIKAKLPKAPKFIIAILLLERRLV